MTSPNLTIPTLTAWRASLEGVTPGEWLRDGTTVYALNEQGTNRMVIKAEGGEVYRPYDRTAFPERTTAAEIESNATHVQRCDPQTIAALLDLCIGMAEALRPFAELAKEMSESTKPGDWIVWGYNDADLTHDDFRRARTAYQSIGRP
jgi:hypothetical protein